MTWTQQSSVMDGKSVVKLCVVREKGTFQILHFQVCLLKTVISLKFGDNKGLKLLRYADIPQLIYNYYAI
jgi:fumarate reductase subunit C